MGEVEGHARQSTETTTLTISVGRPVSSTMVIGLLLTGTRKMRLEHLRHAVVDGERAEHEGVAAVLRDGISMRVRSLR